MRDRGRDVLYLRHRSVLLGRLRCDDIAFGCKKTQILTIILNAIRMSCCTAHAQREYSMNLTYVLVPRSVPSADVMSAISCLGVLNVPGCEHASLFVLSGKFPCEAEVEWFNRDNIVLTVTSRTSSSRTSKELDRVAIAAALDACRMTNGKPPALVVNAQ